MPSAKAWQDWRSGKKCEEGGGEEAGGQAGRQRRILEEGRGIAVDFTLAFQMRAGPAVIAARCQVEPPQMAAMALGCSLCL
ncbi:hypothetical protein SKAU_G00263480 [Synaphobranchus kaupii]|uniref:Uncharacterized protein n=1 Tax=Synaphobranchus kaupii TaxID=118154 RepID=A0A9Q1IPX4_SYNKA|nr:hypothetical protein SKAU_G00263480 [Synaphobranchus kaupii]